MAIRKRTKQIIFYVNQSELSSIEKRICQLGYRNRSAYLRKIAVDGYIIHVDHSYMKEHSRQIRMIGNNINQIAHHLNATGKIYSNDLAAITTMLKEIWQLQRSILLKQR